MTYIQTKEGSVSVRAGSMITHVSRVEGFRALTIAKLEREKEREKERKRETEEQRWSQKVVHRGRMERQRRKHLLRE
jgi:hypothetical protein